MNEEQDRHESPSLKSLVERYQDTKAPLGFAERVAAHTRDNASGRWRITPPWIYAGSFAMVAVCAVLVMNIVLEPEPEPQLARQEKTVSDHAVQDKPKQTGGDQPHTQEIEVAKVTAPPVAKQQPKQAMQVTKAVETSSISPNWDQPADENDFASVAVLWDVADWLDEGAVASPDFLEMPALSDIDALFEPT